MYRGNDNKLFLNYEGTKVDTGLVFNTDKWHTVGISFNEETVISEFEEIQPMVLIEYKKMFFEAITNFGNIALVDMNLTFKITQYEFEVHN